jgi:2-polyprenyl-3-methyl-5-hydroxy-6-metoxy-1,4-benzoquinol methylase
VFLASYVFGLDDDLRTVKLRDIQRNWDEFGRADPLWAILTHADKRGRRWDIAQFLETGTREIDELMSYVGTLGVPLQQRRALDFGCGAGRLTQALARHFTEVCGIDIAPSMIELAEKLNRYGARCRYLLNEADDLQQFSDQSFDFIYSSIVLQHVRPKHTKRYLREFLRLLDANGVLVFQLPDSKMPDPANAALFAGLGIGPKALAKRLVPRAWIQWYWSRPWRSWRSLFQWDGSSGPHMEMHGIPRSEVERLLGRYGGTIVDVVPSGAAPGWISFRYAVERSRR